MGRSFVKNTLSTDKEVKLWEGSYHEIMNEANGREVMTYAANWLVAHLD